MLLVVLVVIVCQAGDNFRTCLVECNISYLCDIKIDRFSFIYIRCTKLLQQIVKWHLSYNLQKIYHSNKSKTS
jgi:hypothetical protein